jgi:ABC-type glycerol-3-phosphate transport system permease component
MELLASGTVIGWTVLAVVIWILIAFWPARVARRKGHSFLLFFIFSLFFFPAALIVAYLVRDRTR